ncbi:MAG TPA: GC-type dockerin domain-anchored protein [Phycisphaerales bacterium]|nr:GC-type dockerin domain-anchored protein [Phycisphaerales bacterium]
MSCLSIGSRAAVAGLLAVCGQAAAQSSSMNVSGGVCVDQVDPDGNVYEVRAMNEFPCVDDGRWDSARATAAFYFAGTNPEADSHASAKYLPDGSGVVVANRESRNLVIFDPITRAAIKSIALSGSPESVAISPDGTRAVTANISEGTASIVDLVSGTEIAAVVVDLSPTTALINSSGTLAVVSCSGSQTAVVIDLASQSVVRTVATGGIYTQVSVNPETSAYAFRAYGPALAGNTLVFPDSTSDQIKLIDITTGTTASLPCADAPIGVAVTPDGTKAVVSHYLSTRILSVVDVTAGAITSAIGFPVDLWGPVAINPAGTKAVVAVQNACRVVDLVSGSVSGDISTASVNEMYTSADGQYAVCVGFRGSLISYASGTLVKDLNNFVSASVGAVSPTSAQAVMFSDTFGEDMVVMTTNGASGTQLSAGPSGPAPEADRARTAAVSPNGQYTVVVNQQSQTATVLNSFSGAVLHTVNVDRRPGEVKITPDGTRAVVTSRDGTKVSIITLATGAKTDVTISTRADAFEISPDSQYAYVTVITGGDGVWRVNLNTGAVEGAKLATGDMGSVGYGYQQFSGTAISPDGATLVTCNSFTNNITMIDTASWTVIKTVSVGTFPTRASFSADGSEIYVSNLNADTISIVSNAGAASAVTGTALVGDGPFMTCPTPDGSKLYVANYYANNIGVVNLTSNVQVQTIPMPSGQSIAGMVLSPDGASLYVTYGSASISFGGGGYSRTQSGALRVIDTSSNTVVETIPIQYASAGLAISAGGNVAVIPQPWGDGVTVVELGCPSDFDNSGFVDTDDFDAFVLAFEAGTDNADFDGSGFVDTDDFDAFVRAFESGC